MPKFLLTVPLKLLPARSLTVPLRALTLKVPVASLAICPQKVSTLLPLPAQ